MVSDVFKHSYKTKTRESLPIAVYNTGVQRCEPNYTWGPGVRDHFLIHHVISGKGTYRVGDMVYSLSAGDSFIIYPSAVVSYSADAQQPWEYCWVGFQGADAHVLIAQTDFHRQKVVHFSKPDAIASSITTIYNAAGASADAELRAIGSLYLFLALLTELSHDPAKPDPTLEYVESAVRFISHNYSQEIDVKNIAEHVGISRSHLYRIFMQNIGFSPNEYLSNFRISRACELLGHSTLPVSAVAASAGFADPLYFSRVFKKITGLPPSHYGRK